MVEILMLRKIQDLTLKVLKVSDGIAISYASAA